MSEQKFPPGWNADRVERLLNQYDGLTEDEQVAADEAASRGLPAAHGNQNRRWEEPAKRELCSQLFRPHADGAVEP